MSGFTQAVLRYRWELWLFVGVPLVVSVTWVIESSRPELFTLPLSERQDLPYISPRAILLLLLLGLSYLRVRQRGPAHAGAGLGVRRRRCTGECGGYGCYPGIRYSSPRVEDCVVVGGFGRSTSYPRLVRPAGVQNQPRPRSLAGWVVHYAPSRYQSADQRLPDPHSGG